MKNKTTQIVILLILIASGIYLIHYALTYPCHVEPIKQTVNGITSTIEQPEQMNKLICLSTNFNMMVSMLIGSILAAASTYKIVDVVFKK